MPATSKIDEKKKQQQKEQSSSSSTGSKFANFFMSIFTILIYFGILIIIGALGLYSGKVAQANILPTCSYFKPYTNMDVPIQEIPVDINVVKTDKGAWSTKIKFPLQENFKIINDTFEILHKWTNGENTNVYKLYIATILQELLACNFTITNNINNFMNSILTETVYILLSPYILFFTTLLTFVVNGLYMSLLWFYNIYLLFSEKDDKNKETDAEGIHKVNWKNGNIWTFFNILWFIFYIWVFIVLFFIAGSWLIIPITACLISLFCLFFPLFMRSKYTKNDQKYNLYETIKHVLKFKLNIIMVIMSLIIILSASSNFGGYAAFVALVACIILYFFTPIYHQYLPKSPDNSTYGLGDYVQAVKKCIPTAKDEPIHEPTMWERIWKVF